MSQIIELQTFNTPNNVDSISSRASGATKVVKKKKKSGNAQQCNGADIAKKMDFDIEPHKSVRDSSPLSMMDVIFKSWQDRAAKNRIK